MKCYNRLIEKSNLLLCRIDQAGGKQFLHIFLLQTEGRITKGHAFKIFRASSSGLIV